jgi:hypothetical protein
MHRMNEKARNANIFETNAGPEELKHLQELLDELDDAELRKLVDRIGILFERPTEEIDRDTLEGVLDETDRETFYREYGNLLERRKYSNGPDAGRFTRQYANACQAYIDLVERDRLTREDAARRMCYERPNKPIHPTLCLVASYAGDAADDFRSLEDREQYWEILTKMVKDFQAGNWYATRWTLSASYIHRDRTHGLSLALHIQKAEPQIAIADKLLKETIASTLAKLNIEQTSQRFLQNAAFVLPREIGDYSLATIEVGEGVFE